MRCALGIGTKITPTGWLSLAQHYNGCPFLRRQMISTVVSESAYAISKLVILIKGGMTSVVGVKKKISVCTKIMSLMPRARPWVTILAGDRFLALSARRRRITTESQLDLGTRIFSTTMQRHLHNSGLYARRLVACVPLNRDKHPFILGKRTRFLDQTAMIFFIVKIMCVRVCKVKFSSNLAILSEL